MTTLALIGAGPGLGQATARRFGREGFSLALISRTQANVDALDAELASEGITARGYAANARDPRALHAALDAAAADLGPIEVLQYSPVPAKEFMKPVLETTPDGNVTGTSVAFAASDARQMDLKDRCQRIRNSFFGADHRQSPGRVHADGLQPHSASRHLPLQVW